MKVTSIACALTVCTALAHADVSGRTAVVDPRPLMIAAIDSPVGVAYGILVGDTADAITRQFKGSSPIYLDVTTERRYTQPGCSRLKVLFWQEGVLIPGAASGRKQTIEMGINYCRDGLPPKSPT